MSSLFGHITQSVKKRENWRHFQRKAYLNRDLIRYKAKIMESVVLKTLQCIFLAAITKRSVKLQCKFSFLHDKVLIYFTFRKCSSNSKSIALVVLWYAQFFTPLFTYRLNAYCTKWVKGTRHDIENWYFVFIASFDECICE